MTWETFVTVLGQLVAITVTGWAAGDFLLLLASRSSRSSDADEVATNVGLPERSLLAVVGFVAFAVALMVGNIVTGGAVFGTAIPVPVAAAVLVYRGWRRRCWPRRVPWLPIAAAVAVIGAIYVTPVVLHGSGERTGDTPWHLGWTEQLLHGEPVPTGPAPEFSRNAYPWGWHAVLASAVRLVPGSDVLPALQAVHILIALAVPLGAACLARRVDKRATWAAAGAAALIGGWGWVLARGPAFIASPSEARYGADLVAASPNSTYELFPPALPRELGVVLLAAAASSLLLTVGRPTRGRAILSGLCLGTTGLVSVPMLLTSVVWGVAASFAAPRGARRMVLSLTLATGLGVFLLWAGPVASDYVRYNGFVSITAKLGREWGVPTALGAWGLLLPAAAGGVFVVVRSKRAEARASLIFAGATVVLLLLSRARAEFDWDLGGNATVLHQGRVWPAAHLLAAALAGVAIARAYGLLASRTRLGAVALIVFFFVVGVPSLVLASIGFSRTLAQHAHGFVFGRPDVSEGSFLRRAAARLGPDDVVSVEGSSGLALLLFSFSGTRLADYDNPRFADNDVRIRYRDLARAWSARMRAGGFDADYVVTPKTLQPQGQVVAEGGFRGRTWVMVERAAA